MLLQFARRKLQRKSCSFYLSRSSLTLQQLRFLSTRVDSQKLTYDVSAQRVDAHGSVAKCKSAFVIIDTDLKGRKDAFNPAELLLAALAACRLKSIERVTPLLKFDLQGVNIRLHGVRQDVPPRMESITYEITVTTNENDDRLDLLHKNIKKYGTVYNTILPGTELKGKLIKQSKDLS